MSVAKRVPLAVYQPIWVKGEVYDHAFQRPSAERYEPIRALCAKFERPFSVLDIGSNYGYFDVRLMNDFPECVCVLVDDKTVGPVLQANNVMDRSVVLSRKVSAEVLESLSRSEHFDVVVAFSVLHHFDDPARAFNALLKLGSWALFEIPGEDDVGAANPELHAGIRKLFERYLEAGYFPSHVSECRRPYYVIENAPYLVEQSIDCADRDAPAYQRYRIETDFKRCEFVKADGERRPFVPGMNLHNFRRLGGGWPTEDLIQKSLEEFRGHPDFNPWNFIVGRGLTPIDAGAK